MSLIKIKAYTFFSSGEISVWFKICLDNWFCHFYSGTFLPTSHDFGIIISFKIFFLCANFFFLGLPSLAMLLYWILPTNCTVSFLALCVCMPFFCCLNWFVSFDSEKDQINNQLVCKKTSKMADIKSVYTSVLGENWQGVKTFFVRRSNESSRRNHDSIM